MKTFKTTFARILLLWLLSTGFVQVAGWTTKRLTVTPGKSLSPDVAVNGSAVYAVWQDDTSGNDNIYFRRSTDGGITWQAAQALSGRGGSVDSLNPSIAASGSAVFIVWEASASGHNGIYFRTSMNKGIA
jgi:hypothetical protein